MVKLFGLVGETGAGKDVICEFIKKKYPSALIMRFSDPLREALAMFLDEKRKEDQQWLIAALRERFGNNILGKAIKKKIKNIKNGMIILNGVRVWEEYKMIKKAGGKVVYITAGPKLRWQRIRKRREKH